MDVQAGGVAAGPWILPVGLLLVSAVAALWGGAGLLLRQARAAPRATALAVGLPAFVAFVVRVAAPAVPHDLNPRAYPGVTLSTLDTPLDGYGPRVLELLFLHLPGLPKDERVVAHLGVLWGVVAVAALGAWMRARGASTLVSAVAASTLALATPLVRYGHTDAPQGPEIAFGLLGLLLATTCGAPIGLWRALAAGGALGLAASMRPEAPLTALAVLAVLLADRPPRGRAALAGLGLCVGLVVLHGVGVLGAHGAGGLGARAGGAEEVWKHGVQLHGARHLVVLDPAYTITLLPGLVAVAVAAARVPLALRLTLLGVTLALVLAVPSLGWSPAGGEGIGFARHQLRAAPWFAVLVALGVDALPAAWLRGVGALAVAVALLVRMPVNYAPRTFPEEYRFFRAHLPDVPAGCTIATFRYDGDGGLAVPRHLSTTLGLDHRWIDLDDPLPSEGCVVWYRPANCVVWTHREAQRAAVEVVPRDACAAFELLHHGTPIAEARLVARRWVFEQYQEDPVRVGFYRLR